MSLARKIAHNTAYQLGARAIGTFIGLVVIQLLTVYLGADGYGRYTTTFSFVQLFSILADFGLYIILIKKISEPNADIENLTNNFFTLRFVSAVLFLGVAPFIALFIPQYSHEVKMGIPLMSLSFLFVTLIQLLTGLFQKTLETHKVAFSEIAGKVSLLLATVLVVYGHFSFLWVIGTVVFGQFINFLVLYIFCRQYFELKFAFNFKLWREILRDAIPIALSITLNVVYFKADTFIMTLFQPDKDIGIYGAAYKILEVVITIPAIFVGLVLPILANHYARKNLDAFKKVYQSAWDALIMMAAPLVSITFITAPHIIKLITRKRYEEFLPAVSVLQILIFAVGIIFLGTLFGHLIVAVNMQRKMVKNYLFVAVSSFIGYIIFIPKFSYYGAAFMTIYAEMAIMLLGVRLVYKTTHYFPNIKKTLKIIGSSVLVGCVLFFLRQYNFFILALFGISLYVGLLLALKIVTKSEIKDILSLRHSRQNNSIKQI